MTDLLDLPDLELERLKERLKGLPATEVAAAKTDFHMTICRDPIEECPLCTEFLKVANNVIAAILPVLREEWAGQLPDDLDPIEPVEEAVSDA